MIRKILAALGVVLLLGVLALAAGLAWAHAAIRRLDPPLPSAAEVLRADAEGDLPVRLRVIETARQRMPRAAVLAPASDPHPDAPYVMSHPSFVLEWEDGRLFLIDTGMTHEGALAFGRPLELLAGAEPMKPLASAAERLGDAVARVAGVAFTHLHTDHTGGLPALCARRERRIPLFQAPLQAEETNYTTRPGRADVERAGCVEVRRLEGGPLFSVPGFPGLRVLQAAGHTPGSQVLVARVRGEGGIRTWVFTGDVVNHLTGVIENVPKPRLYSLLVVPESPARLERMRRFLRELARLDPRVGLLVSHDALALEAAAVPEWEDLPPAKVRAR
jgi:glyoxylase-like metal-dependent hydrolase (beta-lactamase superfamily II)